MDLFRV